MRRRSLVRVLSNAVSPAVRCSLPPRCLAFSTATSGGVAVKEVTRSNFEEALEELRAQVQAADFVAVDLEMTGVTSAPWREAFEFDRSDVRYLKVKDSAEKFAVLQVGVCPFYWDRSKESFLAHPHNFYIFPRKEIPFDSQSDEFHFQTSSCDFLAKHQFDFNTCIYEGISYLSRAQEAEAVRNMSLSLEGEPVNTTSNGTKNLDLPLVRTADIFFTERMKIRFHEWLNCILKHQGALYPEEEKSKLSETHLQTTFFKMRPAVKLSGFSQRQLDLIQMTIRRNFSNLVYICADMHYLSEQRLVVYADSEEDKALLMKDIQNDILNTSEAKISSAVGFRQVIDLLSSKQKLLVGHNCFLDIAHVYSKFIGPLPLSITEFASAVHTVFPHIIDTTHLLRVDPVIQRLMKRTSTSLSSAFSVLCPHVLSGSHGSCANVKIEAQTDITGSKFCAKHEAGYDAFMTGCIFAQACSLLGIDFKVESASKTLKHNEKLQKHTNNLYPSWNGGTVINLQTGCEVPESGLQLHKRRYPMMVFDNTIVLWGFSSEIKPNELRECLHKVFGENSIASIFFVDATSALVQFSKEELVTNFLFLKDSLENSDDALSVLHPLSRLLEGGKTCSGDYEIYRQFCSSPISKTLLAEQAEAMGIRWKTKMSPSKSARCSGSTEKLPTSYSSTEQMVNCSLAVEKNVIRIGSREEQYPHHISCGDILDSLYASHALSGRKGN